MALSGTFETNFQSLFNDAAQAVRSITEMGGAADKSKLSFADFFEQLGKGGLEKNPFELATTGITALGNAIGPTGLLIGAFTASTIAAGVATYRLAEYAADATNKIGDLSEKAGVSTEVATRYAGAFEIAGGNADQFARAMQTLSKGVAENSPALAQGLERIGLSIDDLKAANSGTWLETIADGLRNMKDPTERAAAAMEIFKGQGRELVPVLLNLNEGLEKMSGIEPITAEQKEAAEEYARHWATLKAHVSAAAVALGNELVPKINAVWSAIETGLSKADQFGRFIEDLQGASALAGGATLPAETMPQVPENDAALKGYHDRLLQIQGDQKALKEGLDGSTGAFKLQKEEIIASNAEMKKITEQQAAWTAIMGELNSAGATVYDTIAKLDGEVVEAVKYYLDAGVSQGTLAKAYGLTETQVRAVNTALREYHESLRAVEGVEAKIADAGAAAFAGLAKSTGLNIKAIQDGFKTVEEAEAAYHDVQMRMTLSATDYQIAKIKETVAAKEKAFADSVDHDKLLVDRYNAAVEAVATAQIEAIQKVAEGTTGAIKKTAEDAATAVQTAFSAIGSMFPSPESLRQSTLEPGSMLGLGIPNIGPSGYSISGLAKPPTTNITINGSVLGNKDEIARVVGDALVSSYRAGGNRTPV